MIRMTTEGQANLTVTRRKDTVTIHYPGLHGMTVTVHGNGSFTVQVNGKVKSGRFVQGEM